jgi:predicted HicB family RNase H-like nuclease
MNEEIFEYEGYTGSVNYDRKADYYTGEVTIGGRIYTYEGDSLEELREDFEDIIDSIIAFDEMGDDEDSEEDVDL